MSAMPNYTGKYLTYPKRADHQRCDGGRRLKGALRGNKPGAPLVSVITVCRNSAKTIEQAFQSVFNQTYSNIEYVVIDGASTDATLEIVRKYESRIDYYLSEPDDGLYYAMNKGLELAQGEYILFLNSDDWYTPDAVESLVSAMEYGGCEFVSALAQYIDEQNGTSQILRSMPFDHSTYLRMPVRHETMLIPAALYDRIGPYDTSYKIISDREYARRLFANDITHYEIPRPLLNFRTSGVSNTNIKLLRQEQDRILADEFSCLHANERQRMNDPAAAGAEVFIDIANAHLDNSKLVKASRALIADNKVHYGEKWRAANIRSLGATATDAYPLVSVILPFYNAEETIRASLESVLSQSLENFEIICINDCAIDNAQAIVDKYCRQDPRVKSLQNEQNIGLGATRNVGVRKANGQYIFHLDPDDTLPEDSLQTLYKLASEHGSTIVKGAFRAAQGIYGKESASDQIKYPCGNSQSIVINTSLAQSPTLLQSTEGHWSCLYQADFARQTPYPTDLKMGQDSIFLVNAFARANTITLTPDVVYHYQPNPTSAMNTSSARKFMDEIEWRRRAYRVLSDYNLQDIGEHLLFSYWNEPSFEVIDGKLSEDDRTRFYETLSNTLRMAGYPGAKGTKNPKIRRIFDRVIRESHQTPHHGAVANAVSASGGLKVVTLTTRDHGGAGLACLRLAEAERAQGIDAQIECLVKKSDAQHVRRTPIASALADVDDDNAFHQLWQRKAVVTHQEHTGLLARELFSKTGAVVDFDEFGHVFENADIVHFHWVVGMIDYPKTPKHLNDTPIAWTLHDMNPFTGGCHYSEGCEGYKEECRACPLLGADSELAHENWKIKQKAYAGLRNLHIICPSQWLADCAAESSLFRGRPIHVIPNALPIDRFQPMNKLAARHQLGLPIDKKLIVFGADSLSNVRKGGDILRTSLTHLKTQGRLNNVEGVFFGGGALDVDMKTHNLGRISDERKLSRIYAAADVFAFPSREDNAPLTVVESLLSGTPVVAFPVGNVPEMIDHRDTGYIARYGDIEDFADGLSWALETPRSAEAVKRSIRCHKTARAHNDPEKSVAGHIALYRKMLADNAGGEPKTSAENQV